MGDIPWLLPLEQAINLNDGVTQQTCIKFVNFSLTIAPSWVNSPWTDGRTRAGMVGWCISRFYSALFHLQWVIYFMCMKHFGNMVYGTESQKLGEISQNYSSWLMLEISSTHPDNEQCSLSIWPKNVKLRNYKINTLRSCANNPP